MHFKLRVRIPGQMITLPFSVSLSMWQDLIADIPISATTLAYIIVHFKVI